MFSKSGLYPLKKWIISSQKVEYILSKSGFLTLYNIDIILTFHMMSLFPQSCHFCQNSHFFQMELNSHFFLTRAFVTFSKMSPFYSQLSPLYSQVSRLYSQVSLFVKFCHFFPNVTFPKVLTFRQMLSLFPSIPPICTKI